MRAALRLILMVILNNQPVYRQVEREEVGEIMHR
jgi:hypothetical protein